MEIRFYFLIFFLASTFSSFSQEISMSGTLLNIQNNNPITYVNIGIENKNQGTITDTNGQFNFTIPEEFEGDTITISHLNYHTIMILAESFDNRSIWMQPKTSVLEEVIVTSRKRKTKKSGVKSYGRLLSMRVVSKSNDIVEAAQRIHIPDTEVKVNALNFAVRKWSELDGVKIRINFYENVDNMPGERIVRKNIIFTMPERTESDWIKIDLKEQDIYISQDFIVGIEFIPNFENPTIVDLGSILTKGKGYRRESSQGNWTKLNGGASINVEIKY